MSGKIGRFGEGVAQKRCVDGFKKYVQIFVMLFLLTGFSVDFIGGQEALSFEDEGELEVIKENDVPVVVEEEKTVEENVLEVEENEDVVLELEVEENESVVLGLEVEENESEEINGGLNESEEVLNVSEELGDIGVDVNLSEGSDVNLSEGVEDEGVEDVLEGFDYIDIDELVFPEDDNQILDDEIKEKVLKELVSDGLIELEFEILEDDDIEIKKKEVGRGEFKKDVLISSDEHFDDEVRVFSNLPSAAKEEDIVVTWESEGVIVEDVEYFDLDKDGLIDRISWVVPHLSSQYYSIEIVVVGNENDDGLVVRVNAPENGSVVSNPIEFGLDIDYFNSSLVDCLLRVDGSAYGPLFGVGNLSHSINLDSGQRDWEIYCYDMNNKNVNKSVFGSFDVLNFSINDLDNFYFNDKDISGNVNYNDSFELKLIGGNSEQIISHDFGGNFTIKKSNLSKTGSYELIATVNYSGRNISISESFSVGNVDVDFVSSANEDEDVDFNITIHNAIGVFYDLYVGGILIDDARSGNRIISGSFSSGNHLVQLRNIKIGIDSYPNMSFGNIDVLDSGVDDSSPDLDLVFPKEDDIIYSSVIEFQYDIEDDINVANCTFLLHNAKKLAHGSYEEGDLVFPLDNNGRDYAFNDSLGKKNNVVLKLEKVDEGNYTWSVECYDSAGRSDYWFNYFSVDLNNSKSVLTEEVSYNRQDEVENLIDKLTLFLEREKDFELEEREVLEILGLNMFLYKKQLAQKDNDLKFPSPIPSIEEREKRAAEIYDEIDEIKSKIVLDVKIMEGVYEFSKGSIDLDLGEVIGDYLETSGVDIGKSALKSLVNYNKDLQRELGVSVKAWRLELEYLDGIREVVLVSKNLDLPGVRSRELGVGELVVLEILTGDREVVFVSDVEDVGNNIYSMSVSNLEEGNLVYYFEESFALREIEKMESVLFGEGSAGGGLGIISGMFVGVGDSLSMGSFFWLPLFLFIGYIGFLGVGRIRLEGWKKEPGVEEIVRLINETSRLIREGKIEVARSNYGKMGEIYKALPVKCRDFFYKEIKRIRLAIDKKDVLNLIREYEVAKDEFRKEDAIMLHGKINMIYRKLPRKFQERIYRRLVKKEV